MDEKIQVLFKRYQEGTVTTEERILVETWFESYQGQQNKKLNSEDEISVFEDLDSRINSFLAEDVPVRKMNFRWLQIAAVFFTLLVSGLFMRNRFTKKPLKPETFTEISSLRGVKKEITLKDGTTVFLNSGSSIFISSRFGEDKREVKLTGEAFFQVHHDASKPFVIHSGKLQTTVLGTSFDIRAYPEDEQLKISVATGKVKVEGKGTSSKPALYAKALIHNQALVYNRVKDSHRVTAVNSDSVSSWRTNHLIFENASYEEIARSLGRWYNLDVTLTAHHDLKRYTLSFYNERADKVLNVLSNLTGMTYSMNGRKVIINPKKS